MTSLLLSQEAPRAFEPFRQPLPVWDYWYLLLIPLCIGIWAAVGGGYFWPIWVMMPWAFVLAFHAKTTYGGWGGR